MKIGKLVQGPQSLNLHTAAELSTPPPAVCCTAFAYGVGASVRCRSAMPPNRRRFRLTRNPTVRVTIRSLLRLY